MVDKITVEIALEGGDEIDRQLADTAEAGKKMFGDLQSSADQLDFSGVSDQFQTVATAIDTAQTAVKSAAGFESIIQGVKNVEGAFETLGTAATKMAARMTRSLGLIGVALRAIGPVGIAVGAVGGALIKFGNDTTESINKVNAGAATLGITFQQFDALSRGLQQAGISSDATAQGFDHLKSAGFNVAQALPQIIAQLERMPEGINRTNTAIALLGEKLGVEVVAALRTGSLAANQFNSAMGRMTEEQRKNAALQQQSLNKLSLAWNDFKADVATPIAIPLFDFMKSGLSQISAGIATSKQEWASLANLLTTITPKVGIDISLTGSLQSQLDQAKAKLDEIAQKGTQTAQTGVITFTAWGEAIRMAGEQGGLIFTQWGTVAEQAGTKAAAGADKATTATDTFKSSLLGIAWNTVSSAGVAAWNAITGAIQGAIDRLLQFLGLQSRTPAPAPKAAGGGQFARGGLLGGRGSGTSDSNLAWLSRGEFVINAAAVRYFGAHFFAALNARQAPRFAAGGLAAGGSVPIAGVAFPGGAGDKTLLAIEQNTQVLTKLVQTVDSLVRKFDETFTKLDEKLNEKFDNLDQKIDGLIQTVSGLSQQVAALAQAISQKSGKALGGLLGGRGSGTSDSNLAWVSRGEHIMPARAVAQPGMLAFLEALRRSGGNLRGVLDGMGRFALGGMIRGPMPAFAAGGLAGGMSNVTIQFPGLPAIGGLRASSDVVDQLHRAAALAQVRSGGRKPSRYS